MKKLSAILPHWFGEREKNLNHVVLALLDSSLPPDEIIIWDNTNRLDPAWYPGAIVVRSPVNVGCKAKFLGALMSSGEYVFLTDNDVIVQPRTLEHMMTFAKPGVILTLEGHVLGPDKSYRRSSEPRWHAVKELTPVTTLNCRTELIHRDTVKFLLQDIRFDDSVEAGHEDFYLAAAAHKHGVPCLVVPGIHGEGFSRLSECGVGMSVGGGDHYDMREKLCHDLF